MANPWPLTRFFVIFFQQIVKILLQKCPSSICCWDLNTQPLEHEPTTTIIKANFGYLLLLNNMTEIVYSLRCHLKKLMHNGQRNHFRNLRCKILIISLLNNSIYLGQHCQVDSHSAVPGSNPKCLIGMHFTSFSNLSLR